MDFKLFGLVFRLEVVVACLILGAIIGANLFYGYSPLLEGMDSSAAAPATHAAGSHPPSVIPGQDPKKKQ
jgi:hypothetical protein